MTLIVEDGTGLTNSESYLTVDEATAYHAGMGNTAWAGVAADTAKCESLLRQATAYMVQTYRLQWAGTRFRAGQALDWPRAAVPIQDGPGGARLRLDYIAWNVIPVTVKHACAELALRAINGPLLKDLPQGRKSVKVGPLQVDYDVASDRHVRYSSIDRMLEPMFTSGTGSLKINRC